MGFFQSLVNGMGKAIAEQLWPEYERAVRIDSRSLEAYIKNETNGIRKGMYVLALSERDFLKAREIYSRNKNVCNNAFNTLKNYRRFEPVISLFMRKIADRPFYY